MLRSAILIALLVCSACVAAEGARVKVGDAVSDIDAPDENGKTVKLTDYKGKSGLVVFFYPKANTGG
jgi:hypothetical protein